MLHDKVVDGIILAPIGDNNHELLQKLLALGVRLVQIDLQLPQLKASAVLLDNTAAAYQATQHLLERGHTHIGLVNHVCPDDTVFDEVVSDATMRIGIPAATNSA